MRPNRPLPMLPSQTCRYAATRTMPQRSSRLEKPGGIAPPFGFRCVCAALLTNGSSTHSLDLVSVDAAFNGDWRSKRVSSNDNYFNPRAPHDLSLVKNISLGKRFEFFDHTGSVTYFAVHRTVCRRLQHRRGIMGWPSNYRT